MVVYFAMKQNDTAECDAFSLLFGDFASDQKETVDQETEKDLNQVYNYAKTGVLKDLSGMDPDSIFYVAGLTANSSRICTKFVVRNRFGVILEHVAAHQKDIRILEKQKPVSMIFPNATSSRHFEEIATRLMSEGADVPVHKRGIRGYLRSVFAKNM